VLCTTGRFWKLKAAGRDDSHHAGLFISGQQTVMFLIEDNGLLLKKEVLFRSVRRNRQGGKLYPWWAGDNSLSLGGPLRGQWLYLPGGSGVCGAVLWKVVAPDEIIEATQA
jgi:hypothetical protein